MENAQFELFKDSGVIEGKDGQKHHIQLYRGVIGSGISRFHSVELFVLAFADEHGIQLPETVAMRSRARAESAYERLVRDAKYGELKK